MVYRPSVPGLSLKPALFIVTSADLLMPITRRPLTADCLKSFSVVHGPDLLHAQRVYVSLMPLTLHRYRQRVYTFRIIRITYVVKRFA